MAQITVQLNPFPVPTHVTLKSEPGLRQDGFIGFKQPSSIPLSDLDLQTLEALCAEFRESVLLAARKDLFTCR